MTWSSHIKKLKNDCQPSLSLMRNLSHLSWGADKKTLTHLYKALVQSKLNYACQTYCNNSKITEAVNKIQNEGLRIISGAFKSSPIKSLQVDCNIMPLELQVLETSCRHYIRLKQETRSLIRELVAEAFQTRPGWTFRANVETLLGESSEDDFKVIAFTRTLTPPWAMVTAEVCEGIANDASHSAPYLVAALFLEHAAEHKEHIPIYTDGSKNQEGVGSAAVIPALSMSDSISLPKNASIYSAEAMAIILALEMIDYLPQNNYIIHSDSQSVLMAVRQFDPTNLLIRKIRHWIHFLETQSEKRVTFCWIPAHVGIQGNETADVLAKTATSRPAIPLSLPHTDYRSYIRTLAREKWQNDWSLQEQNKLQTIRPFIRKWESSFHKRRKYETTLTRLRIGHCNFSHVHLMKNEPQPRCCGVPRTVEHVLVCCAINQVIRDTMFPEFRRLSPNDRMRRLLAEGEHFNIEKLMDYLYKIYLIDKI